LKGPDFSPGVILVSEEAFEAAAQPSFPSPFHQQISTLDAAMTKRATCSKYPAATLRRPRRMPPPC
jgi:hypothetical protein